MKKRVPDEWQARQATQATLQVSSSKHNAKKNYNKSKRPGFISRSLPSLQKKKRRGSSVCERERDRESERQRQRERERDLEKERERLGEGEGRMEI